MRLKGIAALVWLLLVACADEISTHLTIANFSGQYTISDGKWTTTSDTVYTCDPFVVSIVQTKTNLAINYKALCGSTNIISGTQVDIIDSKLLNHGSPVGEIGPDYIHIENYQITSNGNHFLWIDPMGEAYRFKANDKGTVPGGYWDNTMEGTFTR